MPDGVVGRLGRWVCEDAETWFLRCFGMLLWLPAAARLGLTFLTRLTSITQGVKSRRLLRFGTHARSLGVYLVDAGIIIKLTDGLGWRLLSSAKCNVAGNKAEVRTGPAPRHRGDVRRRVDPNWTQLS